MKDGEKYMIGKPSDFNLIVGADIDNSYERFKEDIAGVIELLEHLDLRVQIDIDTTKISSTANQIQQIISNLKDVDSSLRIDGFDSLANSVKNVETVMIRLAVMISGTFREQLNSIFEAMPDGNAISEKTFKKISEGVSGLVDEILELKAVVQSINSKDFGSVINISDGSEDLRALELSKEKALQTIEVFNQLKDTVSADTGNSNNGNKNWLSGEVYRLSTTLPGLNNAINSFDLTQLTSQIAGGNASEVAKISSLYGGLNNEIIELINNINLSRGTSYPVPDISKIQAAEEAIKEYKREVSDSGGEGGEQKTSATDYMNRLLEMYGKVDQKFIDLRAQIERTFDLSTVDMNPSPIIETIEKIKSEFDKLGVSIETLSSIANNISSQSSIVDISRRTANMSDSSDLLKQMSSSQKKNSSGTSNAEITNLISKLQELRHQYEIGKIVEDEFVEGLGDIRLAYDRYASSIPQATDETENLIRGSREQDNILRKVQASLSRVTISQNKFTKAKNGKSSEEYRNLDIYKTKLEDLYEQVKNCSISEKEALELQQRYDSQLSQSINIIKKNGEATQTWLEKIGGLAKKFGQWFSVSQVVMKIVEYFKKMVKAVIELDTAMTELRKVTDETNATYDKFLTNATVRAKQLGATVTDVVNASADFARLGYNLGEAEQLADAAIIYKNVGDDVENINDASEKIIATMQAFGITANNVMSIVDKFNKVSNEYAISTGGIGTALLKSAAAMKTAGSTIDETIALATAANTVVQNPEVVGTTLKTISMYLRAAKTDAEEAGESTDGMAGSVSELRKEILALTGNKVDIQIDEDSFKAPYQILKDLSEVWGELSDISQANILEMVGGKRNANVVAALLENFSIAEKSLGTSIESAGSALEENEKVLESIQGRINIMKASFEALANTLIDGDLLKGLVFIGTKFLDFLNWITTLIDKIGGLKTVLISVIAVISIVKAEAIFGGIVSALTSIGSILAKIIPGFGTLIGAMALSAAEGQGLAGTMYLLKGSFLGADLSLKKFIGSLSAAQIGMIQFIAVAALIAGAIIVAERAINSTEYAAKDLQESIEDLSDVDKEIKSVENELSDVNKRLTELESIENPTIADEAEIKNLKEINRELEAELVLLEKRQELAQAEVTENANKTWKNFSEGTLWNRVTNTISDKTQTEVTLNQRKDILEEIARIESKIQEIGEDDSRKDELEQLNSDLTKQKSLLKYCENEISETIDLIKDAGPEGKAFAAKLTMALADPVQQLELMKSLLTNLFGSNFNANDIIENYNKDGFEDLTAYINGLAASGVIDLGSNGMPDGKELDPLIEALNQTEEAAENATESLSSLRAYGTHLNTLSKGFKSLSDIYHDVKDEDGFDFSSLFDSDFIETFGGYTEEYENLINVIADSPNDLSACQDAFNELAAAYVLDKAKLEEVTDETKDLTIAMLEQNGVANAEAIVEDRLAVNKKKLLYASKLSETATLDEVMALSKLEPESKIAQRAIFELLQAKIKSNQITINTSSDIENIINLAKACGASVSSINRLIEAKQLLAKLEKYEADSIRRYGSKELWTQAAEYSTYQNLLSSAQQRAAQIASEEIIFDKFEYDGITNGKDVELEAWNRLVAEKKHLLEMDKITEEEYYSWLASAYKKHISNTKEHRDEIIAIEEELYNWNKEKVQKNIDAELAVLDYERAKGLISEETYFAKRKELYANGYAELQNLVDEQGLYGIDTAERLKAETEFIESVKEAHISSFEAERSALDHKLAMNIISEEQYLAELNRLYNEYYKGRAEYAEEAEEIEEELYDKRVELVEKWANAASDAIQEVADATESMVDALANFVEGAIDTNEENFNLEKSFLDHALAMNYISEEEYYSELEKLYKSYFKDKYAYMEQYWENQEEIYAHEQQMLEDSASAVEDIHSKVVEMIKKELEEAKETIEKTKEEYLDLINIRREALSELKDEDDYEKERNEKLSTISELQRQLNALSYDTSAAGIRKYKEIYAKLQQEQEGLAELEEERAYQIMNDQLDAEEEGIEKAFDAQTGKFDELLEDNIYLVEEAWKRMDGMSETLYQQLRDYNAEYSTSIKDDITDAWKMATDGLEGYKSALEGYKGITGKIGEAGMEQPEYDMFGKYVAEKQAANWVSTSVELGTSLVQTGADLIAGFADILAGLSDNPIFQLLSIGAGSMSSLAGAGAGIISSLTGLLGGLASGSDYVPRTGWYQTDEEGEELKLVKDSHGNQYRLLTEGSKVINAGSVSRLMSLVNNPNLIAGLTKGASLGVSSGEIKANIDTSSRSVVLSPVFQITSSDPKGVASEIKKLLPTIADYTLGTLVNGAGNMGIKRNAKALC